MASARGVFSSALATAVRMLSGLVGSNKMPVAFGSIRSGTPPTLAATTGRPAAIASSNTMGQFSSSDERQELRADQPIPYYLAAGMANISAPRAGSDEFPKLERIVI